MVFFMFCFFFFFNDPATTEIYTLSLHDALPISFGFSGTLAKGQENRERISAQLVAHVTRSEEHTSELQSQSNLVCRLLLEKKKKLNENERSKHHGNAYNVPHTLDLAIIEHNTVA